MADDNQLAGLFDDDETDAPQQQPSTQSVDAAAADAVMDDAAAASSLSSQQAAGALADAESNEREQLATAEDPFEDPASASSSSLSTGSIEQAAMQEKAFDDTEEEKVCFIHLSFICGWFMDHCTHSPILSS